MSHNKDTDYLAVSARVRAMENRLLTRERMEQMIEARDHADAAKVLTDCGYGELNEFTAAALETVLARAQSELFRDLGEAVGNRALIDVFRIKYDYHNAKVLVKAQARGVSPAALMLGGGRFAPEALEAAFQKDDLRACTEAFSAAIARAKEALASTGDSQLCDFILDRACYEELSATARESGSAFVEGYARLMADAVNLRSVVRTARLGKDRQFLEQALVPGGSVSEKDLAAARMEDLPALFDGPLAKAAEAGAAVAAPNGGSLTEFEKLCDDGVGSYIAQARRVPFGEQVVVGYLYAREAELTAIRTIMNGRLAGLEGDIIRQRLRRPYV